MKYSSKVMNRLINSDGLLVLRFLTLAKGAADYGEAARFLMFGELTQEQLDRYEKLMGEQYRKQESSLITQLDRIIKMYGWGDFAKALEAEAQNREHELRYVGLTPAAEKWKRVAEAIRRLPRELM